MKEYTKIFGFSQMSVVESSTISWRIPFVTWTKWWPNS